MKKQEQLQGAFIEIPLNKGYTYARILNDPYMAFYDIRTEEKIRELEKIALKPILFITSVVATNALKSKDWEVIGILPLEEAFLKPLVFYMRDTINPNQFFLFKENKMIPAKKEECIGLELSAVWQPEHIESRLNSHYFGSEFEWGEYLLPLK